MDTTPFDPAIYLTKVGRADYLEVKYRIMWFRDENPNGLIEADLVMHDYTHQYAIFKATVINEQGGKSIDYGSEEKSDFGDYIEKAATKAIGRALASLGYGTQFCDDHEFGAEQGRVVDSPVDRGSYQSNGSLVTKPKAEVIRNSAGLRMATTNQIRFLETLLKERGEDMIDTEGLPFEEASQIIERLKQSRAQPVL